VLCTQSQGRVVVGKSVSRHHSHCDWQRTELRRVYRGTGKMETAWASGVYGGTAVAERHSATGSIYSGHPGVDRSHHASHLVSHIISSYRTVNYTLYHSRLFISVAPSETLCGDTQLSGFSQPGSIQC